MIDSSTVVISTATLLSIIVGILISIPLLLSGAISKDDQERVALLSSPRVMLLNWYKQTENMHDLKAVISKAKLAVSATPKNHPN